MDYIEWLGTVWKPGERNSNEKQLDGPELCSRKKKKKKKQVNAFAVSNVPTFNM